jgi:class 3 adenylate cyclase
MASPRRRLCAILHADVNGFVRLMEGKEDLTFQHLKLAQSEIWRPAIETAGGSLVNNSGDSILAEFDSPRAAIAAAIDIQERMARFNESLDEDWRLMFRIGVHLGEVIVDEEERNIFGCGVNLAERIQGLAEPGGIAVSRTVRDLTELHADYAFVDGGEHWAKNVSRPLHIYHVHARAASAQTTASGRPRAMLHCHGTDLAGRKFGFDLDLRRLEDRQEGVVIGRDVDQCDLILSHPTVSRRHARLVLAQDKVEVADMGSTNGTSVDGAVVQPGASRPVESGARLRIGDIELAVRYG